MIPIFKNFSFHYSSAEKEEKSFNFFLVFDILLFKQKVCLVFVYNDNKTAVDFYVHRYTIL